LSIEPEGVMLSRGDGVRRSVDPLNAAIPAEAREFLPRAT
jgi:hypothetical protein